MKWIDFPDDRLSVRGLPWFGSNKPELWRLPARARKQVRAPVWNLAEAPCGGRIQFRGIFEQERLGRFWCLPGHNELQLNHLLGIAATR